ncbi:hypothetical protein [Cupriavidus sp. TMH.W2]|uniref:hypothetical protein n=1 Tax=Cupriavidus sp. TMH.W2 TaxID=3434465 RepID=UPI003D775A1C
MTGPTLLTVTEALDARDYPRVADKVATLGVRDHWCRAAADGRECACIGCANRHLTWAEYECWKKYAPQFNQIGHAEARDPVGACPTPPTAAR